uniref:uncharacterized protein LOC120331330 n=1 Tax=Styela clava TaxID=7725 RepID=UPI00193A23BD|nr:uncharacterized protein LOC120331330 [Styela clava]
MWMACQIEVMDECICFLEESSTKENIEESLLKRNVSISEFDSSQTPVSNLLTSPTNSSISSIEVGTILKTSSLISELSEDIEQSCTNESTNQPLQLQEESDAICVIDERTSQSRSIFSRATRVFPMEVPAQNEKTLISTRKDSHSHIDESELKTIKPEELSFPRTNFSQKSNTTILEPIPRSEPHHIELPADLGLVGNPIAPIERPSRLPPINFGTIHK